jgi:hypothetical protein
MLKHLGAGIRGLCVLLISWTLSGKCLEQASWVSPKGAWVHYYHDIDLQDWARLAPDEAFKKDFREAGPRLSRNKPFSARWNAWLMIPASTNYTFLAKSDDGLRFIIDDTVLIDSWNEQDWQTSQKQATIYLEAGRHPLRVEYFNLNGPPVMKIEWTGGPIPKNSVLDSMYLRKRWAE